MYVAQLLSMQRKVDEFAPGNKTLKKNHGKNIRELLEQKVKMRNETIKTQSETIEDQQRRLEQLEEWETLFIESFP